MPALASHRQFDRMMVVLRAMFPPASQPRSNTATSVMAWLRAR
jgi:hypothetical protein